MFQCCQVHVVVVFSFWVLMREVMCFSVFVIIVNDAVCFSVLLRPCLFKSFKLDHLFFRVIKTNQI